MFKNRKGYAPRDVLSFEEEPEGITQPSGKRLKLMKKLHAANPRCPACALRFDRLLTWRKSGKGGRNASVIADLVGVDRRGFVQATIDHKVPRSKGGSDAQSNLQLMCDPCNAKKGNQSEGLSSKLRFTLLAAVRVLARPHSPPNPTVGVLP